MGGRDLWSNGIDLNVIETAQQPQLESWSNINAIDDLVYEILDADSHVVISAVAGNAGAGGVALALAADVVCARAGVVLNPHYRGMELFGSEYWTYLFPRRVGEARTAELTESCLPISARRAQEIGLVDHVLDGDAGHFHARVERMAAAIVDGDELADLIGRKRASRRRDESVRPLHSYRDEELAQMQIDFCAVGYQRARKAFVHKTPVQPFTHPAAVGSVIRSTDDTRHRDPSALAS